MRDELEAPFLDEWLLDTEVTPPDPKKASRRVASQLPQTRQVGRWLPFPVFRRKAHLPTATDTAEYQPTPIPAGNGHTPTVIGRTQSMLSPVKAITAGAIVFALGGAFLIAQPFGQQSSVPGAETVEFVEPVEVTGEVTFAGSVETWTTDDPRLTGEGTWDPVDGSPMEPAPDYFLNARSLTTDEGVWRQLPVPQVTIEGKADDPTWDMVLIGEGGYEGLVFIAQATWQGYSGMDVHGYIVDTTGS